MGRAPFMAEAMRHGYKVLKPWGDSAPFDVALYFGTRIVRVQVKSTSCRAGTGYFCQFKPTISAPLHPRPTRLLRRLRNHAKRLVSDPSQSPARRTSTQAGLMLCPMQPLKKIATATNTTAKPGPYSAPAGKNLWCRQTPSSAAFDFDVTFRSRIEESGSNA